MNTTIPKVQPKALRVFFFWIGLFSTVAYRMIIFFSHSSPQWLQIAWYSGTIGYIIYFVHRYQIALRRERVIQKYQLATKVPLLKELNAQEQQAMSYVFSSLSTTREQLNYIAIFVLSTVALLYGFFIDFVK